MSPPTNIRSQVILKQEFNLKHLYNYMLIIEYIQWTKKMLYKIPTEHGKRKHLAIQNLNEK